VTWIDNSSTEFRFDILRADVFADGATTSPFVVVGTDLASGKAVERSYLDASVLLAVDSTTGLNASGGTQFAYKVAAVGATGSAESGPAVASTIAAVAPPAPTNFAALAQSESQVALTWTDTAVNETGFVLKRTANGVTTTFNLAKNAVSFTDTGLPGNTLVSYTLVSTNAVGDSTPIATASATTLGATALNGLTATANSPTQITLAWTHLAAAPNATISSYAIDRTGGAAAVSFVAAGSATGFIDNNALLQNTTYSYTVKTVNSTGLTPINSPSLSASATTLYAVPAAITAATATATSNTSVSVNWVGGAPATTATVARCTATVANFDCTLPSSIWLPSVSTTLKPYVDNSVVASSSYVYRVTAVNGTGTTAQSSNMATTNLVTTPGGVGVAAPTGLTAAVSFALNRVTLTWTDAATNETAFVIERSIDGVNFAQVGTAASRLGTGLTRTFNDAAVSAGQTYYYRVIAQNVTGASVSNSAPSNVVKVDYFLTAPSGLTATIASTTQVTLNWVDRSTAETSFAVWRADGAAAPVQIGTVTRSAALGTASGGAVTFNNTNNTRLNGVTYGLVLGHTYTYYVTAVNGTVASTASNSISVPFVAPAAPATLTAVVNPVGSRTVVLTWSPVPNATSYTVQRTAPGGTVTVATNTTALTAQQTGLTRGTTYTYTVRANGLAGSSALTTTTVLVP
jgi:titin